MRVPEPRINLTVQHKAKRTCAISSSVLKADLTPERVDLYAAPKIDKQRNDKT